MTETAYTHDEFERIVAAIAAAMSRPDAPIEERWTDCNYLPHPDKGQWSAFIIPKLETSPAHLVVQSRADGGFFVRACHNKVHAGMGNSYIHHVLKIEPDTPIDRIAQMIIEQSLPAIAAAEQKLIAQKERAKKRRQVTKETLQALIDQTKEGFKKSGWHSDDLIIQHPDGAAEAVLNKHATLEICRIIANGHFSSTENADQMNVTYRLEIDDLLPETTVKLLAALL